MKRYCIILLLLLIAFVSEAQDNSDYIRRGDEAMKAMNYSLASMYYDAVVVVVCDMHSIKQLTKIWQDNVAMRTDMNNSMRRCFACLDDEAKKMQDTTSIQLLVTYYSEGIGTGKNNEMAEYWIQRLDEIRNPSITMIRQNGSAPAREKEKMKFFAGYHASLVAPFGIQVGGMGKNAGWYVRFGSNLSFQEIQYECYIENNHIQIPQLEKDDENVMYRPMGNTKQTWLTGSAGLIIKVISNTFVSVGAGYWDRQYYRDYINVDDSGFDKSNTSGWAKDKNRSMNGLSVDLDGYYTINRKFYISLGASMMSFKYVYPHLGVGVYF